MPFFAVSLLIQVAFIVHVLKTGRNTTWVFVLLFFPLIGTLVYLIVEVLPGLGHSRSARQARRSFRRLFSADRDLQAASRKLYVADTVQNASELARQHLERKQFAEAKEIFARYLKGIHADDPVLLLGLAQAHFGLGAYAEVIQTLDLLKEKHPSSRSPEAHLLYARAHEEMGLTEAAIQEYDVLHTYFPGPEAACRLGLLLKARGDTERAKALFQRVMAESEIAGRPYKSLHKEWLGVARREVQG